MFTQIRPEHRTRALERSLFALRLDRILAILSFGNVTRSQFSFALLSCPRVRKLSAEKGAIFLISVRVLPQGSYEVEGTQLPFKGANGVSSNWSRSNIFIQIKCDKAIPCSSCGTLGIPCQAASSRLTERPRAPPTNQHASHQNAASGASGINQASERNWELIEDRLSAVEKSIQELSHRSAPGSVNSLDHHSPSISTQSSLEITTAAFEGQSSFGSATLLAKKAADISVARVPGSKLDENVYRALLSLKSNLDKHHPSPRSSESTETASTAASNLNLPPVAFVISLIRRVKGLNEA
ncbi:hypothetical protein RJZ90_002511 [Blastomyces dermatitidis]